MDVAQELGLRNLSLGTSAWNSGVVGEPWQRVPMHGLKLQRQANTFVGWLAGSDKSVRDVNQNTSLSLVRIISEVS